MRKGVERGFEDPLLLYSAVLLCFREEKFLLLYTSNVGYGILIMFNVAKERGDKNFEVIPMIVYDEGKKIFHLTNGSVSYMVYVNDAGYLETLYFGKALREIFDPSALRRSAEWHDSSFYYDETEGKEHKYSDGYKNNSAPLEVGTHGFSDKRRAPVVVNRSDGSTQTDFRYVAHRIYHGIDPIEGLPHVINGEFDTVEFVLKESSSEVYLHHYLSLSADKDLVVKSFRIENDSDAPIKVLRAESMQLDLPKTGYRLAHFHGRWQNERNFSIEPLTDGIKEISSNFGRSSHEENPFLYLLGKDACDDYGEVIGFNLVYSGNFLFRAQVTSYGGTHINYGINDEDFTWTIEPGESFSTPQAIVVYSYRGTEEMSRTFHRLIKDCILSEKDRLKKRIPFNSWEGCFFDYDTKTVLDYIDDGVRIGTELFVLDDGWFGKRNNDAAGLGDWKVNEDKVDLHKVVEHCKKRGIAFGIWLEPEMINFDSDLFRAHPEYVLGAGGGTKERTCIRHQFCLDFSRPDVVEEIYRQLKLFLDEYRPDYIKWDCNRIVGEHYSAYFPPDRQGEIYHRVILGYYDLLGRLCVEYPETLIEGCASGGGRFDLGTLYYTPQIWASDESDPAVRMEINYNTSIGYPLSTIGAHVNASPVADYRTKAILALFGTYGYEMNPNRLTDEEKSALSDVASVYKKYHKSVIEEGTLYHLLSPNDTNWMAMQCVDKDRSVSLAVVMNRKKEWDRYRYLRLKGLDPEALYKNDYEDAVHTGEYLMNVGINLSSEWCGEFACRLIGITKV